MYKDCDLLKPTKIKWLFQNHRNLRRKKIIFLNEKTNLGGKVMTCA